LSGLNSPIVPDSSFAAVPKDGEVRLQRFPMMEFLVGVADENSNCILLERQQQNLQPFRSIICLAANLVKLNVRTFMFIFERRGQMSHECKKSNLRPKVADL
jgi:hypothetical protein